MSNMQEMSETARRTKAVRHINAMIFDAKNILADDSVYELGTYRKNMVTKVVAAKTSNRPAFVFLMAVSYFDSNRMLEIAKAGLQSMRKEVKTKEPLNEEFVTNLTSTLSCSTNLTIVATQDAIRLVSELGAFMLMDKLSLDEPAMGLLVRSISLFFAMCGKTVSTNLDDAKINDYGFVNVWYPNEPSPTNE